LYRIQETLYSFAWICRLRFLKLWFNVLDEIQEFEAYKPYIIRKHELILGETCNFYVVRLRPVRAVMRLFRHRKFFVCFKALKTSQSMHNDPSESQLRTALLKSYISWRFLTKIEPIQKPLLKFTVNSTLMLMLVVKIYSEFHANAHACSQASDRNFDCEYENFSGLAKSILLK